MKKPTRNTKLMLTFLIPSSTLFLILISFSSPSKTTTLHLHPQSHLLNSKCDGTRFPDLCVSTLSTIPNLHTRSIPELITATLNRTIVELILSSYNLTGIGHRTSNLTVREKHAINDCLELFEQTKAELLSALSDLDAPDEMFGIQFDDVQTVLSAAMTNQDTCLDGFPYVKGRHNLRDKIQRRLFNISRHVSNSLGLLHKIPGFDVESKMKSKEAFRGYGGMNKGFPTWVTRDDRKLLDSPVNQTRFDLIVAKDGTGNFTTVTEAVDAAPNNTATRFVIYIKEGAYFENVEVVRKKPMLMFVGDGIGKTIIKAYRNVADGNWTTFRSATVAVVGSGFIAKGITIENGAGPTKHQAVALRSGSDFSAFYQCSFVGYQDTLYVHSLRQFYRECNIYGTVDFIFGNAAVVFQNCNLYARRPLDNQKNMFTAQGREDPNQNTGISILHCKVEAAADLIPVKTNFTSYLGRPWKEYSRTVYMESYIGDLIAPAGWSEWTGDFALSTLYYAEYLNRGPGSNTSSRVAWPGFRVINDSIEADQFTVGSFIQGYEWLNSTDIPYYLGLNDTTV